MIIRNTFRAIALATTCLAPLTAFAQDYALTPVTSTGTEPAAPLVVGGWHSMAISIWDSAGCLAVILTRPAATQASTPAVRTYLGAFDITGRAPWDSGGTRYYELNGENLIFQTGNRYGRDSVTTTPRLQQHQQQPGQQRFAGVQGGRSGHLGREDLLRCHYLHRKRH